VLKGLQWPSWLPEAWHNKGYICNVTYQGAARDGGPAVLRPVRATLCLFKYSTLYNCTYLLTFYKFWICRA